MLEDLLGYLMGALEPDEIRQVEEALDRDPELRERLEELRASLTPLEASGFSDDDEPPAGLADRTCDLVFDFDSAMHTGRMAEGQEADEERVASENLSPAPLSAAAHHRSWSMADVVVAAGVFLAASMLFFPAILNSQYNAQKLACQNNLRQIGFALTGYSQNDPERRFPLVPEEGNRSFAGIYASVLLDEGYLDDSRVYFCPTSEWVREAPRLDVPTLEAIDCAAGPRLAELQRRGGGSYGYNLGHAEEGRHVAPKNLGRNDFVLATDAPTRYLSGGRSANHSGRGQNMLFEGGHVQFIAGLNLPEAMDHPFRNHDGFVEAGVNPNDSVVGSSETPPYLRQ